jgi:DNA mismatch repair protein MSH2
LGEVLAQVDVLNSFAVAATSSSEPYCRPKLLPAGSGVLSFTDLRHPCLEKESGVDYVPNDAVFDKGTLFFAYLKAMITSFGP